MDPQLSDSESDDFDEDLLQQDHLNLIRALGNPLQKVSAEPSSEQEAVAGAPDETDAPQQDDAASHGIDDVSQAAARNIPHSDKQRQKQHLVAQQEAMSSALEANKKLQEKLELVGGQLAQLMEDNEKHIASITQLRKSTGPRKGELLEQQQLGSSAIGPSRFWVKGHQVPEQNADATALLKHYPYLPHRFDQPQPWTAKNCSDLQTQVLRVVKDEETEALIEESRGDMTAMLKAVHCMTLGSPGISEKIKNWSDEFWQDRISPMNGRSGKANRIHWNNHCSPATNDAAWSPEEEAELLEIANQHFHHNWEAIAEALGTGRTAMACFVQVKKTDQLTKGKGAFTDDEQQRIREGLTLYGQNWAEIASHVGGGRSRQQVMHHFKNVMDVTRKGRWSDEEDRQLASAVSIVGDRKLNRWSSIAEMVHGRSQTQCRERWCNVLDPTVKTGTPWTKNEVAILKAAVQQYQRSDGSTKWAAVAAHLPGRTDSECTRQVWRLNGREPKGRPAKKKKSSHDDTAGPADPDLAAASLPGGTAAPSQQEGAQPEMQEQIESQPETQQQNEARPMQEECSNVDLLMA